MSLEKKDNSKSPASDIPANEIQPLKDDNKNGNLDFLSNETKQPPLKLPYNKLCKVYVDLFPSTFTKHKLSELFSPFGEIETCHIEPDRTEGADIAFGYVIFKEAEMAKCAIEGLEGYIIGDIEMYIDSAPKYRRGKGGRTGRKNGRGNTKTRRSGNLELRGFPSDFTVEQLKELILPYGHIVVANIKHLNNDNNERVGIVQMGNGDVAEATKCALDGTIPPGFTKPICISFILPSKKPAFRILDNSARMWNKYYDFPHQELSTWAPIQVGQRSHNINRLANNYREPPSKQPYNKCCKVYVDVFPETFTNTQLKNLFSPFGEIEVWHIEPDRTEGANISFGFVIFKKEESASVAIKELADHTEGDNVVYVGATPKSRRGKGSKSSRKSIKNHPKMRRSGKLEIRGLPSGYTVNQLKELICPYGHIVAAKVELSTNIPSEMVGIVQMGNGDIAEAIKVSLHGTIPSGFSKPLHISFLVPPHRFAMRMSHIRRRWIPPHMRHPYHSR